MNLNRFIPYKNIPTSNLYKNLTLNFLKFS